MALLIESEPIWQYQTNTYIVAPGPGGPAVVIDVPPDPEAVGRLLAKHDLTPVAALITHGHIDHVGGVDGIASPTVRAYLHPDDVDMARHPRMQLEALFGSDISIDDSEFVSTSFVDLIDKQTIELADMSFDVIHTPGHTPGHCCFRIATEGVLFSGDHLFAGSIGRTDLPGGSYETLMTSMAERILPLPLETDVLPGHGPRTTLVAERRRNPFLQELL